VAEETLLLLPPSERKAGGGTGPSWQVQPGSFPQLAAARSVVRRAAARGRGSIGPVAAALAAAAEEAPTRPALDRYTGVLYDALSVPTMGPALRRAAAQRVGVVSGLAGLVTGGDPVPDYTLPMGASLPRLGGLGAWWRPRLSPVLDAWVDGAVVWDLLPGVHARVWSPRGSWRARWQVRVLREAPDGTRSTVSHDNKAVKGSLARHVLETSVRHPEELRDWRGPTGYGVDLQTSTWTAAGGVVDLVRPAG